MSQGYDNTNRGVLFKNDDKDEDNQPDYKGKINFGGQDCWLSAWIKTSKTGSKFMSLSVKPMDGQTPRQRADKRVSEIPDDLPF